MSNLIATDRVYPSNPEELEKWRPEGVRNLAPGLVERGKIKIGRKGEARKSSRGNTFQMPEKLDHFLITSMERGQDGNFLVDDKIMSLLENNKEIPVFLVYDDPNLNFPTRYAMYKGKTLQCTGDGEFAKWRNDDGSFMPVSCPCPRQAPSYTGQDKCKINGTLSVVIDGAEVVGGVWKFRTTSYNTVVGILSSLAMIRRVSGGALAGIPLVLRVTPKSVQDPIKGSQQTIYVVSLEYRGSMSSLQHKGYSIMLENQKHGVKIEHIESHARALLADMTDPMEEDAEDIVPEFYPEQQEGYSEEVRSQEVIQQKSFINADMQSAPIDIQAVAVEEVVPQEQPQAQPQAQPTATYQPQSHEQPINKPAASDDFNFF